MWNKRKDCTNSQTVYSNKTRFINTYVSILGVLPNSVILEWKHKAVILVSCISN
jgi:hypothetical protein